MTDGRTCSWPPAMCRTTPSSFSSRKSRQQNLLLLNDGHGAFRGAFTGPPAMNRGVAFGDFDRDGRVDAVVTRLNEPPVLLRNVMGAGNHWLALKLIGSQEQPRRHRRARDRPERRRHAGESRHHVDRLCLLERTGRTFRTGPQCSRGQYRNRVAFGIAADARKCSCRLVCLRARAPALIRRARRKNLDLDRCGGHQER